MQMKFHPAKKNKNKKNINMFAENTDLIFVSVATQRYS